MHVTVTTADKFNSVVATIVTGKRASGLRLNTLPVVVLKCCMDSVVAKVFVNVSLQMI
jgi:hypothetical protein